jgi:hypothetical protein
VDLDQHVILSHLRVWHFANPYAVLFSIAIYDECLQDYPTRTGTSFLEAFQSCPLMKSGARRRINASCLD